MRSNTSLYVGVYIWIASLEIRTKNPYKNPSHSLDSRDSP